MADVTDEQLLELIAASIRVKDFETVAIALRVLAVQNPHAAQDVLGTIDLAQALR